MTMLAVLDQPMVLLESGMAEIYSYLEWKGRRPVSRSGNEHEGEEFAEV